MKPQKGSTHTHTSTLSLTSELDGGGWLTPRLGHFTSPGKETRHPLYRKLGGPQGRSGQAQKISPPTLPTGIRSPDRSELLCRLSYPYRLSNKGQTSRIGDFAQVFNSQLPDLKNNSTCIVKHGQVSNNRRLIAPKL